MRSYEQFCPLASALDLVGDRWTMLVVRELGITASRYSDLHDALPGIATNLLADRLRTLTASGVVTTRAMPAPSSTTVYELTAWGRELYDVLLRLGRWGVRTLVTAGSERAFRARYAIPVAQAVYGLDADLAGLAPIVIRIDAGDDTARIEISDSGVVATVGPAAREGAYDVLLDGDPLTTVGLLAGVLDHRQVPDAFHASAGATRRWAALVRRAVRPSLG